MLFPDVGGRWLIQQRVTRVLDRWKGETVCIAASGPSLVPADVGQALDAGCKVIVINETWRASPAAHVLYAADYAWWASRAPPAGEFKGERWTTPKNWTTKHAALLKSLHQVETKGGCDIVRAPPICTGSNSSFQALSLAVLWGAKRVVFTGLDMKCGPGGEDHWHGVHEELTSPRRALGTFAKAFERASPQLVARGVEVINASRDTALTCFPRASMREALT